MTPEATYSALALFDRWAMTLRTLAGEPLPELPAVPGRVHADLDVEPPDTLARETEAARVWRELAAEGLGDGEGSDLD